MSKLKNWIAKNKPARKISKFEKYRDEINMLVKQNYTQKQICKYLFEIYNIETTRENLSQFLKRQKNNSNKNESQNTKKQVESKTQKQKNEEYLKMLESMGSKIDVT